MKRCAVTLILIGMLVGCSKEDVDQAKQKVKEAGQEVKKEVDQAGTVIKKKVDEAGTEIKKEVDQIKHGSKDGDKSKSTPEK